MLLGNRAELIRAFESHNDHNYFTRNSSMSKLQRLKSTSTGKPKRTKWSSTHPDAPSKLIKGQFKIISGYTDAQIEKFNIVWKLIRNSWNLSKSDLISHLKKKTMLNSNVDVDDVVNFYKVFKFDVSKFQGTAKQISNTAPTIRLSCEVQQKEIAVCGDILEVCDEYYLNMITVYGRFTHEGWEGSSYYYYFMEA